MLSRPDWFTRSLALFAFASGVLACTATDEPQDESGAEFPRPLVAPSQLQNGAMTHPTISRTLSGKSLGLLAEPVALPGSAAPMFRDGAQLPSKRDPRGLGVLPAVRDQAACGSCWAFGSMGALETTLLGSQDYAENHMKNTHGFDVGPCDGGNRFMSTAYLARWSGPVAEQDDPYDASSVQSPPDLMPRAHVQEVYFIADRTSPSDNESIKEAVDQFGSVSTTMFWTDASYSDATQAYRYDGESVANHMVVIVGWDDEFPADAFNPPAPESGAYLIRNSWGEAWGDAGYFWISYHDDVVGTHNAAYPAPGATDNYDVVHRYDELGWTSSIGYGVDDAWMANVFTASQTETVGAVGLYAPVAGTSYELRIRNAVTDDLPVDEPAVVMGTLPVAGYHTISVVEAGVTVQEGMRFSVVVHLTTPGYGYPLSVEGPVPGYSSRARANAGESWVSHDGVLWGDLSELLPETNVCISVFSWGACDDGNPCTEDLRVDGECEHPAAPSGVVCRVAAGACDDAEVCDGQSTVCPSDAITTRGKVCRPAEGRCDIADVCTGLSPDCPEDQVMRADRPCHDATSDAEVCDGAGKSC